MNIERMGKKMPQRWRIRRLCGDVGGFAAIEFAFIAPVLVLVLVGFVQATSAFFTLNQMGWVARDAARGLAVGDIADAAAAQAYVDSRLTGWAAAGSKVTISIPNPVTPDDTNYRVAISVPLRSAALIDPVGYLGGDIVSAYSVRRDAPATR